MNGQPSSRLVIFRLTENHDNRLLVAGRAKAQVGRRWGRITRWGEAVIEGAMWRMYQDVRKCKRDLASVAIGLRLSSLLSELRVCFVLLLTLLGRKP